MLSGWYRGLCTRRPDISSLDKLIPLGARNPLELSMFMLLTSVYSRGSVNPRQTGQHVHMTRFGWNRLRMTRFLDSNSSDFHCGVVVLLISYLGHGTVHRVELLVSPKASFGPRYGAPLVTTLTKKRMVHLYLSRPVLR